MASIVYNSHKRRALEGAVDLVTVSALKCLLLKAVATTPDNEDHDFLNDVAADEFDDTGYTPAFGGAGRKALAGRVASTDNTNDRAELDFDDFTWSTLGGTQTVVFAILGIEITNDGASPLVSAHDLADTATNGTDFQLIIGADGGLHYT